VAEGERKGAQFVIGDRGALTQTGVKSYVTEAVFSRELDEGEAGKSMFLKR